MLKIYLKSALRGLFKNKLFNTVNILGLTICMVSCLTIFNMIMFELSVDDFHENKDQVYRLLFDERPSGRPGARVFGTSGPPAGPTLADEFVSIKNFVRFRYSDNDILQIRNKSFYETGIFYADSTLFNVFSFQLKYGDKATALSDKNSVIISEEHAKKYFGDQDPIGQVINFNNDKLLRVTGVFSPPQYHSHLDLHIVLPFHAFEVPEGYPVDLNEWSWASFHTYILLQDGTRKTQLESEIKSFTKQNLPENIADRFTFTLQPLDQVYFSEYNNDQVRTGTIGFIWALSAIGLILALLALLNFINLSTSRLINRTKEMGLRKVLGAGRVDFTSQFLIETITIILFSAGLAMVVFEGTLRDVVPSNYHFFVHLIFVLILSTILSLIATTFPAWISLRTSMISALKGEHRKGKSSSNMRKGFIAFQFSISLVLITASIIVNDQLDYIQSKDLGYNKEQLLVVETGGNISIDKAPVFKTEFSNIPGVRSVAFSSSLLDGNNGNVPIRPDGYPHPEGYPMSIVASSPEWLSQIGVELIAGRFSRSQFPYDQQDLIINESALKILEKSATEVIGLSMQVGEILTGQVIGVVKDFNYSSTHTPTGPLVIFNQGVNIEHVYLRITDKDIEKTLNEINNTWTEVSNSLPFTYHFMNEYIRSLYEKDYQFKQLVQIFSYVAIFLSVFGLYGLVSFIVGLELKQIAIRKVLGAGELKLYLSELKLYIMLILISVILASPLSYYLMNQWLNEFAYRIEIGTGPIFLAILIISAIVVITISHLIIRAVKLNPVENLRSE